MALWLTHDVKYVFDLGMDGSWSWVNLGLILLCVAWVFGCQENGSEHRSVYVVFGLQESERKL